MSERAPGKATGQRRVPRLTAEQVRAALAREAPGANELAAVHRAWALSVDLSLRLGARR